jgi:arginine deiminase
MDVGATSEVGRLRTVLLHRPGRELSRLTPRNSGELLFDGIPWLARAQQEHDAFADVLRRNGIEVLLLRDLLEAVLSLPEARDRCIDAAAGPALGSTLQRRLGEVLHDLPPADLAEVLIAGLARNELPRGSGLQHALLSDTGFVLPPLPNVLFTRDLGVVVGNHMAVASLAMPARRREASLLATIVRHHPRFAGVPQLYDPSLAPVEGGDVLLLGPGVLAVGTGERTTPAGVETLARRAFAAGVAHIVLAVPIQQARATMHLDTICTMVDVDQVVMWPEIADSLLAYPMLPDGDDVVVEAPQPFLKAATDALGVDAFDMIDTALDPVTAEREQWDDGNNTLAIAPRVAIAYERNEATNARLVEHGIDLITIPGSEVGSGRGGPRCMSCPIARDDV